VRHGWIVWFLVLRIAWENQKAESAVNTYTHIYIYIYITPHPGRTLIGFVSRKPIYHFVGIFYFDVGGKVNRLILDAIENFLTFT